VSEAATQERQPFPFVWEKIAGHKAQKRELRRLLAGGRLPHALLFSGPEGVGKGLAARLVAAAVLCREPSEGAPCGVCPSCRALAAGGHPDYYELQPEVRGKGTRTIRIEAIRELTELAARYPVLSDRRVLLIDSAETMNEAAANSLLKTLEEPPGQVTFILLTSARSSLLDTIVSRCMPLSFGMLLPEEMQPLLVERGLTAAEAEEVAALADGSVGRALALYAGGGLARRDEVLAFLGQLHRLDMEEIWRRSEEMGGWEREAVSEWLLCLNMLLRDMLVLHEDGGSPLLYHGGPREELAALLTLHSERRLLGLLACVRELMRRLTANVNLRLQLEGFFIQLRDIYIH